MEKNKKISRLGTLALLLICLNTSTIYTYYYKNIGYILLIAGGILTIYLLLLVNKIEKVKSLYSVFILIAIVSVSGVFSRFSISTLWLLLKIILLFTLTYVLSVSGIKFYIVFLNVLKILAVWAVFNQFLFYTNLIDYLPVTATYQSWKKDNLYLLVFYENYSGITFSNITYIRMSAPFSEPGVLAVFLNMGFLITLWLTPKGRKQNFWISFFLFSIILCLSTWGLIILGIQLLWYFIKKKKRFTALFSGFVIALMFLLLYLQKRNTFSFYDRFRDLPEMFTHAIKSLPWGTGLGENETKIIIDPITGAQHNMAGNYTGLLTPLLDFGIGSIYYYYLLFICTKYFTIDKQINRNISFALALVLFGCLLTQPLALTTLYLSLICNGLVNRDKLICEDNKIPQSNSLKRHY